MDKNQMDGLLALKLVAGRCSFNYPSGYSICRPKNVV